MTEAAGETKEYPSIPRPIAGWVCSPMSHVEVQVQVLLDQGYRMPTQKHCTGLFCFLYNCPSRVYSAWSLFFSHHTHHVLHLNPHMILDNNTRATTSELTSHSWMQQNLREVLTWWPWKRVPVVLQTLQKWKLPHLSDHQHGRQSSLQQLETATKSVDWWPWLPKEQG